MLPTVICFSTFVLSGMVSHVDRAKRGLVTVLNQLAVFYNLVLGVARDSTATDVRGAFKKLSKIATLTVVVEATNTKRLST